MKSRSWMPVKESPKQLKVPFNEIEMDCLPQSVAVVGAASLIGGRIVQRLLALGHFVTAIVDIGTGKNSVSELFSLPRALQKLKTKKVDFATGKGILSAIKGCDVIMHCGCFESCNLTSSFYDSKFDVEEEFQLLQRILEAAEFWESVKRVILTLPASNITSKNQHQHHQFTDTDWNTTANQQHLQKQYSKILLERFAWKRMRQQERWDLVTVHCDCVFGPPISVYNKEGSSAQYIQQSMSGNIFCMPQFGIGITDVRDVAAIHSSAVNRKSVISGRYVGVAENVWITKVHELIQNLYPKSKSPLKLPRWLSFLMGPWLGFARDILRYYTNIMYHFQNEKTRDLLFPHGFMSAQESVTDMIEYFMETGIVSLPI